MFEFMDYLPLKFFLAISGLMLVFSKLYPLLYALFISLTSNNKKHLSKYGKNSWAVVTGATDGIGYGFCCSLAKIGFNIILISRNKEKLDKTAKFLAGKYEIGTFSVQVDFRDGTTPEFYENIYQQIKNFDISMIVNNVGTAIGCDFLKNSDTQYFDILNINLFPIVCMTRMLLPQMKKRKLHSAVINISSLVGLLPQGYGSVYSASKAFGPIFTRALKQEFKASGFTKIDFLCVCPLAVTTPLTRQVKKYGSITARSCATGSLKHLGKSTITCGHFFHNFQYWTTTLLPEAIMLKILARVSKKFYESWEDTDKKNNKKQKVQ